MFGLHSHQLLCLYFGAAPDAGLNIYVEPVKHLNHITVPNNLKLSGGVIIVVIVILAFRRRDFINVGIVNNVISVGIPLNAMFIKKSSHSGLTSEVGIIGGYLQPVSST